MTESECGYFSELAGDLGMEPGVVLYSSSLRCFWSLQSNVIVWVFGIPSTCGSNVWASVLPVMVHKCSLPAVWRLVHVAVHPQTTSESIHYFWAQITRTRVRIPASWVWISGRVWSLIPVPATLG